jgi:hypothetical protein
MTVRFEEFERSIGNSTDRSDDKDRTDVIASISKGCILFARFFENDLFQCIFERFGVEISVVFADGDVEYFVIEPKNTL